MATRDKSLTIRVRRRKGEEGEEERRGETREEGRKSERYRFWRRGGKKGKANRAIFLFLLETAFLSILSPLRRDNLANVLTLSLSIYPIFQTEQGVK